MRFPYGKHYASVGNRVLRAISKKAVKKSQERYEKGLKDRQHKLRKDIPKPRKRTEDQRYYEKWRDSNLSKRYKGLIS